MGLKYEPYSEPFSAGVREMRKRDAEGRQGRETKKGDKSGGVFDAGECAVYERYIRALLGTASQFCEVVVLQSRT